LIKLQVSKKTLYLINWAIAFFFFETLKYFGT
jgi:hypothetical protein